MHDLGTAALEEARRLRSEQDSLDSKAKSEGRHYDSLANDFDKSINECQARQDVKRARCEQLGASASLCYRV